ncbi:EF-hand domain-containing protein [Saccharothrix sp. 6-C]|uniref:EF-hand domain-containing protein n=1 Tax=Saccharothrix sp. 6-C TaxID=2781735 RepID=UPI0019175795|nr:EF-hand domain-containing protein [Saccharothrix sp. 6-C]
MTSSMMDRKFDSLFDWFDQNRDGHLTHDDLEATATVFSQVAPPEDHANITAIHDAFEQWWQLLLRHSDTDGDGRVSRDEFIAVMKTDVTAPEHFESAVMAIADAILDAFDTDGDGVLSRAEYLRLYGALGVARQHTEEAFTRLDRDGSGTISYEEYRQAIVDFYLSTDPEAPGNYLLGPVDHPA